jgi:WD40 repeat protein
MLGTGHRPLAAVVLLNSPGYALAWSPSGDRLAVACGSAIALIDIKSGELREVPNTESKGGVAWLPDGKRFLVHSYAGTTATLTVYDAELLELDRSIRTEELTGRSASLSPDGKRIAATYADKLVRVWDVESCERIQELTAEAGEVAHVAWSPAGDRLATVGKSLIVWDPAKGERLATAKLESTPLGVAWSADGRHVAVGLPTAVDLYSAADAALTDTLTVTGRLPAAKLAITPDGRYRAVGPIADQLVYVALTDDYRQVTYTPPRLPKNTAGRIDTGGR